VESFDVGMVYSCIFCAFRSSNGINFVKHLFDAHSLTEPTFRYQCGISSCTHIFTQGFTYDTFRGHCARKHHNWQYGFIPNLPIHSTASDPDPVITAASSLHLSAACIREVRETESVATESHQNVQEDFTIDHNMSLSSFGDSEQPVYAQDESIKMAAAKFILTLKEKYKLTQASLDYTVKSVHILISMSSKQSSVSGPECTSSTPYPSPFDDLMTEYQQNKYFKDHFGLIVSLTFK